MRALLVCVLGLSFLAGCACQEPTLDIEARVLDSIPVVPLITNLGVSTALLGEDSTLVTVSHAIPRGEFSGPAEVSSASYTYNVLTSGDGLQRSWTVWDDTIADLGQGQDWAKLSLSPALTPGAVFHSPATITWSSQPPLVGEQLVLVGYTMEGDVLQRYWVPVQVIASPAQFQVLDAGHHVWFRTLTGKNLRNGFSGAPLLRQSADGVFEFCAMMVSSKKAGGIPLDVGVAIYVPKN